MMVAKDYLSLQNFLQPFWCNPLKEKVALVPTMGFLHEGHLSLIRIAKKISKNVVVSIFVNPTQFNNPEDYDKYPIDLESDLNLLKKEDILILYIPNIRDIYKVGYSTKVIASSIANHFEGKYRPGHFDGVATVVSILFNQVRPNIAIFGEKDWQQLAVIRQMVSDLSIPVEIIAGPLIRDQNGLALSSRNKRLSSQGLKSALGLYRILSSTLSILKEDLTTPDLANIKQKALDLELSKNKDLTIEYFEIVNQNSLKTATLDDVRMNLARGLIAGYVEGVRLIDNMILII